MLPALLARTDVVLELRDARLPLTSVNRNFEGERLRHGEVFRRGEEVNLAFPHTPPHHTTAMTPTITGDPERFARVVRVLHHTRKSNPPMTKMAYGSSWV
jgi:hypothetical protein